MGPLWVMGQWSIDCGCCHIVMRFVKKKKSDFGAGFDMKMPTTFWLYHHSFMIGWVYWSTLGTCERAGFLARLAALAFPIIHVKWWEHAQTEMSIRCLWSQCGPQASVWLHGLHQSGTFLNVSQIFTSLLSLVHSVVCVSPCHLHVCIPVHEFQVHY